MDYEKAQNHLLHMLIATAAACEFSGLNRPMVDYLAREGLVQASGARGMLRGGRGKPRGYTRTDLALLRIGARCLDARLEIRNLRTQFAALRRYLDSNDESLSSSFAILASGKIWILSSLSGVEVASILSRDGLAVLIDIGMAATAASEYIAHHSLGSS